jgi:hypothetical protein
VAKATDLQSLSVTGAMTPAGLTGGASRRLACSQGALTVRAFRNDCLRGQTVGHTKWSSPTCGMRSARRRPPRGEYSSGRNLGGRNLPERP